eukprot:scaffold35322_cov48-Phaeocystis_antarctica.AAC.4
MWGQFRANPLVLGSSSVGKDIPGLARATLQTPFLYTRGFRAARGCPPVGGTSSRRRSSGRAAIGWPRRRRRSGCGSPSCPRSRRPTAAASPTRPCSG